MLKISKLADYAVILICHIAQQHGDAYSAQQIASDTGISLPTVRKILKLLLAAELLISNRGVNGGYGLAKAAESISLLDTIAAIDGRVSMTQCCDIEQQCDRAACCQAKENWQTINHAIVQFLGAISLTQMYGKLTTRMVMPVAVEG